MIINLNGHKITVRPLFGQNKERTQLWQWWQWTIISLNYFFELWKYYSNLLNFSNIVTILWSWIGKDHAHPSSKQQERFFCVFTSSIKCCCSKYHGIVVQRMASKICKVPKRNDVQRVDFFWLITCFLT